MSEKDDHMDSCFHGYMHNMTEKQVYEARTEIEHTDVTDALLALLVKKYYAIMPPSMDTVERRRYIKERMGELVLRQIEDYYRGVCDYEWKYERRES